MASCEFIEPYCYCAVIKCRVTIHGNQTLMDCCRLHLSFNKNFILHVTQILYFPFSARKVDIYVATCNDIITTNDAIILSAYITQSSTIFVVESTIKILTYYLRYQVAKLFDRPSYIERLRYPVCACQTRKIKKRFTWVHVIWGRL